MLRVNPCHFYLRRTVTRSIGDFPLCMLNHPPLISEFPSAASFHDSRLGYLCNLYTDASPDDPFLGNDPNKSSVLQYPCISRVDGNVCGVRYFVSAPVSCGSKCLRVPFLLDTGAKKSMLHTEAIKRFGNCETSQIFKVGIGHLSDFEVQLNTHTTVAVEATVLDKEMKAVKDEKGNHKTEIQQQPHLLGYLNILGSDFLTVAVPELGNYFAENLTKFQPPLDEVIVTDGVLHFPVLPAKPTAMHLKNAIKKELSVDCAYIDAYRIVIKTSDGKKMGDRDTLHAKVEYKFELPDANAVK